MLGNYQEESIQHSEHGESFKSRKCYGYLALRPCFPLPHMHIQLYTELCFMYIIYIIFEWP